MMREIPLVRRGVNALKPRDGDVTPVVQRTSVKFTLELGVTGSEIEFSGDTPFDNHRVGYEQELPIRVAFNASDPRKNRYKYRCHGKGPNGEPLDSEGGGGEIEIVQS
jgi:hypothetical protein